MVAHLTTAQAQAVTKEDRRKLKPFLNPRWGTDDAGTTTTPFLFVACQRAGAGNPVIRASITVGGREKKQCGQRSLHAALLCALKDLIPLHAGQGFAPAAFPGGVGEEVRTAAVARKSGSGRSA